MGFRRTVVLVVSDNKEWAARMQRMLGSTSYIPVTLTNWRDERSVFDSINSLQPDIVLLDLDMKDNNSLSVARNLKGDPKTTNILRMLASSYQGKKDRWKTSVPYIDSWLQKPSTQRDVITAIEKVLRKHPGENELSLNFCGRTG